METGIKKPLIAIIDDDPIIHEFVRISIGEHCDLVSFMSGEIALENLVECAPDLILLDVIMSGIDGFETIARIKANPVTASSPVIFLTSQSDPDFELRALNLGAVDYINKPFSPELLSKRIEIHINHVLRQQFLLDYNKNLKLMVEENVKTIKQLQSAIIYTLADLVEMRDNSTGGHVLRTQDYFRLILDALTSRNLYGDELQNIDCELLIEASQLHDIGKVAIPDAILLKPGPLNKEEIEIMKSHSEIGYKAIERALKLTEDTEFLEYAAVVAISHHEKWDGSGYPYSLSGKSIPLAGRIMALVDVYDALMSERPYKKAFSHDEATRIIVNGSGQHFDPTLISAFLDVEGLFRTTSEKKR